MSSERPITVVALLVEWVTVERFCELSGYSGTAIAKKTAPGGLWKEGEVWKWGDDGRKLIWIPGFNRWAKNCEGKPSTRGRPRGSVKRSAESANAGVSA